MWPWEHVVFAYLLYSLYTHAMHGRSPAAAPTVVLAFAAVLPDLIDKPLAWEYGVFATGYALGHSILFAIPLVVIVRSVARAAGRPAIGAAFAVGYLSHLLGDVLPATVRRGEFAVDRILWPFRVAPSHGHGGLGAGFGHYFEGYVATVLSLDPTPYVLAQLALLLVTTVVWVVDGTPPLPAAVAAIRSRIRGRSPPD